MQTLPGTVAPYRETQVFDAGTVPAGLLRDHKTKAGVWGVIHVLAGTVTYRIARTGEAHILVPGTDGIIEPEAVHSVSLSGDASFKVVFWR